MHIFLGYPKTNVWKHLLSRVDLRFVIDHLAQLVATAVTTNHYSIGNFPLTNHQYNVCYVGNFPLRARTAQLISIGQPNKQIWTVIDHPVNAIWTFII